MKILTLDIETRPNLAYIWGLWDQNAGLNQVAEFGSVISFAAKWHGKKPVEFRSDFHDGHTAMVQRAWELIDEADVVVGYNSKSFDMKHLKREFVLAGMTPPSPYKDVDLMLAVKRQFKFASNKLDHVAKQLGLGAKVQHDGFDLWRRCMEGDAKAWATMRRYNKHDVVLTEQLYDRLLPWIPNHPHHGLYVDDASTPRCGSCGSTELQRRGYAVTQLGKYQRFQCQGCGAYSRGKTRTDGVDLRQVA